jgi:hypothetical protein
VVQIRLPESFNPRKSAFFGVSNTLFRSLPVVFDTVDSFLYCPEKMGGVAGRFNGPARLVASKPSRHTVHDLSLSGELCTDLL